MNNPDRPEPPAGSSRPGFPVREGGALVMAPMAELTHAAFRRLTAEFGGCDLYYTEMLSAGALLSASPYESSYTDLSPFPEQTVVQLVGARPEQFAAAARKLRDLPFAGLDVNMGCSVGTIRKRGWGVELMKEPEKAVEIMAELRAVIPDRTLSAKLRLGETEDPEKLLSFCRRLEEAGADYLTLNPRIRKDGPNRPGRWDYVRLLRQELKVPVVGNGDITDWPSFIRRRELSGAGGFMIGRGGIVRPWLFAFLRGRMADPAFTLTVDLEQTAARFFRLLREHLPADFQAHRARRFFFYFLQNLKFGHQVRFDIQNAATLTEMEKLVEGYFQRNPEERFRTEGQSGSP